MKPVLSNSVVDATTVAAVAKAAMVLTTMAMNPNKLDSNVRALPQCHSSTTNKILLSTLVT